MTTDTYDCGCEKRPYCTATLHTCPEAGFAHGYATEPFICDGDYHLPCDSIEVEVAEVGRSPEGGS